MNRPHVHIVDDDAAMRDTLCELCQDADLPCRCFPDAESFLEQWCQDWRGCLLLDYKLPGMDGLQLQAALPGHDCHLPVVFLTAHGDVPEAVRAIRDGAVDFLLKPFQADELRSALDKALAQDRDREGLQARYASLTGREREVCDLLVSGLANKQMATELGLSLRTVELHRARVLAKMEVDSIAQLVRDVLSLRL